MSLHDDDQPCGSVKNRHMLMAALGRDMLGGEPNLIEEIGNGNLNSVFRVACGGHSLIAKVADPFVRRAGPDWPLSIERLAAEYRAYETHGRADPEILPDILLFDPMIPMLVLEDVAPAADWRSIVLQGGRPPGVGWRVGTYVGRTFVATGSAFVGMTAAERIRHYCANPTMIDFTDNAMFIPSKFALGPKYVDSRVLAELPRIRSLFRERADCLLHADLHSGSIMVDTDGSQVHVIDLEFAAYGPVSFDLGVFLAHLVMAHARFSVLEDAAACHYVSNQANEFWEGFFTVVSAHIEPRSRRGDQMRLQLLDEARLFLAAELNRRVLGFFSVPDLSTLDEELRVLAENRLLESTRTLLSSENINDLSDLWQAAICWE